MYRCVIQYAGRPWLGDGTGLAMPTGKVRHKYQAWCKGAHSSPVPAPSKNDRLPSKNATRKAKRYKGECPNMGSVIGTRQARQVCYDRMAKRVQVDLIKPTPAYKLELAHDKAANLRECAKLAKWLKGRMIFNY